jgi:hypothetical protein
MTEQIEAEDHAQDDYALLLAKLGRTLEQDQLVSFHELGHFIVDRATGTDSISYISITPEGDCEGVCRGARSEAFVKAGATGPACIDAADVRQLLAPLMPEAGESRSDTSDIYASVFDAVTQLMAGEAAEQLTFGVAQPASDDRRQAAELAALICRSPAAIQRFIDLGLQQAIDLLSEHVTVLWSLGIILRMRRNMTASEMDEALAIVLAGEQVAIERHRRQQWQARVESAAAFKSEPLRK